MLIIQDKDDIRRLFILRTYVAGHHSFQLVETTSGWRCCFILTSLSIHILTTVVYKYPRSETKPCR